jgi:hypothetical protein
MRSIAVLVCGCFLSGCAGTEDLGKKFSASVTAFAAGIGSDVDLQRDLEHDFLRKSEQLEWISLGTYACGDPRSKEVASIHESAKRKAAEVKRIAEKEIRKKFAQIDLLIGYGETISSISEGGEKFNAAAEKMRTAIGAVANTVGAQATVPQTVLSSLISIAQIAEKETRNARIAEAATRMQPALLKIRAQLKSRKNLRLMTATEEGIFELWDACARERLAFLRDYHPPRLGGPKPSSDGTVRPRYAGVSASSALEFQTAYETYMNQREAFLARRPDYSSLLDAIVDANQKIIDYHGDVGAAFDTVTSISKAASDLNAQTETIRKTISQSGAS